ncbi:MAG: phage tail fiber protein [Pseudomonadota bacterium]
MPYSYSDTVASGDEAARRQIAVPFGFLAKEHITVTLDGETVPTSGYTWVSTGLLTLTTAPPVGVTRRVRRFTPRNSTLVSFAQGGPLPSRDLNTANLQSLYISQEIADEVVDAGDLVTDALDYVDGVAAVVDEQAEAAAAANSGAQAALSSVLDTVGMGTDRRVYGSVAELLADSVPAHVSQVSVLGYASALDWGGFTATRSTTPPSHYGVWTSADGAKWVHADPEVHFETWGAVGNGTTNDIVAVGKALTVGKVVRGLARRWYGVAGNVLLPSGLVMEDTRFRQLTPTGGNRRTLLADNVSRVTLRRVTVDRNGTGTYGNMNDDAGVWIAGGSGHLIEDLEVFGWDMGNGLVVVNATDFSLIRPRVYNIQYVLATNPGDDRVQGIWLTGCSHFTVADYNISSLGGSIAGAPTSRWSRALAIGGCSDFSLSGGRIFDVDQGVDITGGDGNIRFRLTACASSRCRSYGFKFANSPIEGNITSCIGVDCGLASFVVSGPVAAGIPSPRDITFTACKSINVGSNREWLPNAPTGFLILQGPFDTSRPRPVKIIGCEAIDTQAVPTMAWGARNQINNVNPGEPFNQLIDFTSRGHTAGASTGFQYPAARLRRTAAQSIPNNNTTFIAWDAEYYDGCNLHSTTSNTEIMTGFAPGWYRVSARAGFAASGAGKRQLWLRVSGVNYDDTMAQAVGSASLDTILSTTGLFYLVENSTVVASVFQDSGGSLNLLHAYSTLEVAPAMNQNAAP